MARLLYAASPADYFINTDGTPNPSATALAYTTRTGSTQVVDMLDASGSATTIVSADNLGGFRFSGPDGYTGSVWVQGAGGTRYEVKPTGMAEAIAALQAALAQEISDRSAAITAALATATNYTDNQIDVLGSSDNPFPQYLQVVDVTGEPILTYKLIVAVNGEGIPTPGPNQALFYGG